MSPQEPIPPGVPEGYLPPETPATIEHVRSLRRWLAVVGVWAVAASAIALLALLEEDERGAVAPAPRSDGAGVAALERTLDRRLDKLERDLERSEVAPADIRRLDRRLKEAEGELADATESTAKATEAATQLGERIDDLEQRIEKLENEPPPDQGSDPDQP